MPREKFTYDWTQFTQKIEIAVLPERVFHAWTDEKEITRWFVIKAVLEPKKGGRFYMEFLTGESGEEKIVGIRKNRYFCFTFGPDDETVEITVKKTRNGTDCILHQYGLKTSEQAKVAWHMGCKNGWTFFLTNLKAYLEHGIDLRGLDPNKSYKQDYVNS